jgi:hypothetical protein
MAKFHSRTALPAGDPLRATATIWPPHGGSTHPGLCGGKAPVRRGTARRASRHGSRRSIFWKPNLKSWRWSPCRASIPTASRHYRLEWINQWLDQEPDPACRSPRVLPAPRHQASRAATHGRALPSMKAPDRGVTGRSIPTPMSTRATAATRPPYRVFISGQKRRVFGIVRDVTPLNAVMRRHPPNRDGQPRKGTMIPAEASLKGVDRPPAIKQRTTI